MRGHGGRSGVDLLNNFRRDGHFCVDRIDGMCDNTLTPDEHGETHHDDVLEHQVHQAEL